MAEEVEDYTAWGNKVAGWADTQKEELEAAIQEMIVAAGEQMDATFDLDDIVTKFSVPDWYINEPPPIPVPTGTLPSSWNGVTIPEFKFNPQDYLSADLLQRYSYDSDFFDNFLDAKLRDYIVSEGYFLAQTVQDALFSEARNRDLRALEDALDKESRFQGRKGFSRPVGLRDAAFRRIIQKYQDEAGDRNSKITALIAEKSLQEKMGAIDAGIKMEEIRSRFQLEYNKVYWQAAEYLIREFQAKVQAEISRVSEDRAFIALVSGVQQRNVEIELEEEKVKNEKNIARLSAEMKEMSDQVSLWKETYLARIEAARQTVNYHSSAILAKLGTYNNIDYADRSA